MTCPHSRSSATTRRRRRTGSATAGFAAAPAGGGAERPDQLVEPSGEFAFESREPVTPKGLDREHVLPAVAWQD